MEREEEGESARGEGKRNEGWGGKETGRRIIKNNIYHSFIFELIFIKHLKKEHINLRTHQTKCGFLIKFGIQPVILHRFSAKGRIRTLIKRMTYQSNFNIGIQNVIGIVLYLS